MGVRLERRDFAGNSGYEQAGTRRRSRVRFMTLGLQSSYLSGSREGWDSVARSIKITLVSPIAQNILVFDKRQTRETMPVRIGAVSYLNTKPLIYSLQKQLRDDQLKLDLPSRLADQLVAGELDIALIPSVEYFRNSSELAIVSDACIACQGAVRSVQLLFQKPPTQVRTLALDEGSRTSAVLAQVLLFERFRVQPNCQFLAIADDYSNCAADAVLVIGDRAMNIDRQAYVECWDLGEHWNRWACLPFVFAMWVTRQSDLQRPEIVGAVQRLEECRNAGLQHLREIATLHASRHGLTIEDCMSYFQEQLHFVLGAEEQRGLKLFQETSTRLGLLSMPESVVDPVARFQTVSTGCD